MLRTPKRIRCKICKEMFENPLYRGSSIVIVTCDGCRRAMFSSATLKKMEKKGTKGEFTAKAKKAGYTKEDGSGDAQAYAKHVLANKDDFDEEPIKQAQFAANVGKMAKEKKEE